MVNIFKKSQDYVHSMWDNNVLNMKKKFRVKTLQKENNRQKIGDV